MIVTNKHDSSDNSNCFCSPSLFLQDFPKFQWKSQFSENQNFCLSTTNSLCLFSIDSIFLKYSWSISSIYWLKTVWVQPYLHTNTFLKSQRCGAHWTPQNAALWRWFIVPHFDTHFSFYWVNEVIYKFWHVIMLQIGLQHYQIDQLEIFHFCALQLFWKTKHQGSQHGEEKILKKIYW